MIIKDLFTYFAQFVPKDALRDMFYQDGADGSAYASLKEEVLALPDTRIQGELTDFIFGPDEDSARERISHTRGVFLFVDYSAATSYIDRLDVKTDKMHIGVTVAVHTPDDTDQPGLALLQDQTLRIICDIRRALREDSYDDPTLEWLPMEASTLTPFLAKSLANATGWYLELNSQMTDKL